METPFFWIPLGLICGFWLYAILALFTGRMRAGKSLNTRLIDRREEPIRFWFSWVVLVAVLVMFSIMLLQYFS